MDAVSSPALAPGMARSRAYRALAVLLAPPESDDASWDVIREVVEALTEVGVQPPAELRDPPADRPPLRQAWERTFGHPGGCLVPVESCYRPWTLQDRPAALACETGCLLSDHALHVAELYRAAGVTVPPEFRATPDHLVLEIEFMALLAEWGTLQDQARMHAEHLDWVSELVADARRHEVPWPYGPALEALLAYLEHDAAELRRALGV